MSATPGATANTLYYGDDLDIVQRYVADESVDPFYLAPPFNSSADYNVLFAEQDGSRSAAQIKAFGDTWRWDESAALAYEEIVEQGRSVSQAMRTEASAGIYENRYRESDRGNRCDAWGQCDPAHVCGTRQYRHRGGA